MAVTMKKLSVADWYKWFCSTEAHLANVLIGSRLDNTSGLSYSVKGELANLGALV